MHPYFAVKRTRIVSQCGPKTSHCQSVTQEKTKIILVSGIIGKSAFVFIIYISVLILYLVLDFEVDIVCVEYQR